MNSHTTERLGQLFRLFKFAVFFLFVTFSSYGNLRVAAFETTKDDVEFTKGVRAPKIPLLLSDDGHIFLRVRVNNSQPLLFGLDSGFEQTAINTKLAKILNLEVHGESNVTGGGENEEKISFAKNIWFQLPGVGFRLKEVGVLALEFPSPLPDEPIAGILGYDFFSRFVVEIDYQNNDISISDPGLFRYRGTGNVLRIRMRDNYPCVSATVQLPGLRPVTGLFAVDTGAGGDIFFNSPFVKKHRLLNSKQKTTEAATLGIGGTGKIRIGRATSIRLGKAVLANPVVHFSLATKGDSATTFSAGHLGNNLFRQFKVVVFDATRNRLILGPKIVARLK